MEDVAAFSLACNLLQLAGTSRDLVRTVVQLRSNLNGTTNENQDLRLLAENIKRIADEIRRNEQDTGLLELANTGVELADEQLAALGALQSPSPAGIFKSIRLAIKKCPGNGAWLSLKHESIDLARK
jgi:hypothetical protein